MQNIKMTYGSIESFTGGLFATTITSKSGASTIFKGSVVAYSNDIKEKLGIDISKGVITKNAALDMAKKGALFLGVDICISFTGNAGPKVVEGKPKGLVFICINNDCYELHLKGTRKEIQKQAVKFAITKLSKKDNFFLSFLK